MTKELIEMYSQDSFDHESHIVEFLQTSAVYLGMNVDQEMALSHRPWLPIPLILTRETQHA